MRWYIRLGVSDPCASPTRSPESWRSPNQLVDRRKPRLAHLGIEVARLRRQNHGDHSRGPLRAGGLPEDARNVP